MKTSNWMMFCPGDESIFLLIVIILSATLLSGLTLAASWPLRRSPAARHNVLLTGLICTVTIPLFIVAFQFTNWSLWHVRVSLLSNVRPHPSPAPVELIANSSERIVKRTASFGQQQIFGDPAFTGQSASTGPAGAELQRRDSKLPATHSITADTHLAAEKTFTWIAIWTVSLIAIWLAGSFLGVLRYLHAALSLSALRQRVRRLPENDYRVARVEAMSTMGLDMLPDIGISDEIRTPMAAGIFHPLIILPASILELFPDSQIHDILVHEAAHVVRGDLWVVHLEAVGFILFWPIPFVRFITLELSNAREEICDIYVLKKRQRCDYGQTLLQFARLAGELHSVGLATAILQRHGRLERRIVRLLDKERNESTRIPRQWAIGIALVFMALSAVVSSAKLLASGEEILAEELPPVAVNGNQIGETSKDITADAILQVNANDDDQKLFEAIDENRGVRQIDAKVTQNPTPNEFIGVPLAASAPAANEQLLELLHRAIDVTSKRGLMLQGGYHKYRRATQELVSLPLDESGVRRHRTKHLEAE